MKKIFYRIANTFSRMNVYSKLEIHHLRKVLKYMRKLGTYKFSGKDLDGYEFKIIKLEDDN